jgi:hypothetical protein
LTQSVNAAESFDFGAYRLDLRTVIISLLNEAAYLFQSSPGSYGDAMGSITSEIGAESEEHAKIFQSVGEQIRAWGSVGSR